MKKLFALVLVSLVSVLAIGNAHAAPPPGVMSESLNDGINVRTRTLDSTGMLTASACTVSSGQDGNTQHRVSQSR